MIRTLSVVAAFAALALPAMAENTATKAPEATTTEVPATRGALFTEDQARTHLTKSGFVNVSALMKDRNGAWTGTGSKDGKIMTVTVDVKGNVSNN